MTPSAVDRPLRRRTALLSLGALLAGCASGRSPADADTDAPEPRRPAARPVAQPATYADALAAWRSVDDVHAWIAASFEYDVERAVALSESERGRTTAPAILEPDAFFVRPVGVCVDLSRFAVETLRQVAPGAKPRYLMIEFDPATLRGQVLRRHWVVAVDAPDGVRVFADSKRPGVVAGPYPTVGAFVTEYARYRGRAVLAFRETDSFRRRTRVLRQRLNGDGGS